MQIALTGATGFIGRYIAERLAHSGHQLRCWKRESSDVAGFEKIAGRIEWLSGSLGDRAAARQLVAGCDAVVHAALWKPGAAFRGGEGDVVKFAEVNLLGSLQLIDAAIGAGAGRFVFISTCAVHEKILDDRPLDETHPLWPTTHYGAHKAAIEKFVHSYGLGDGYPICALRPSGVYGVARPIENSKWFSLVRAIVCNQPVNCRRGGKEVHAADVAQAVELLLAADNIAGQAYSCCDRYISEYAVATIAKRLSNSTSEIRGEATSPKHQISTEKIRSLGMEFGGAALLEETIGKIVAEIG